VGQGISDEQLDRLMGLVERVRAERKAVQVKAIAAEDIYAAGPLSLDSIEFAISTLARPAG
jgi:uncharacterized protein (DUF3084 family)